jgi:hypothetical protein
VLRVACETCSAAVVASLLDAYGERGGAAVQAGLAAEEHRALRMACESCRAAVVASLLDAYGERGGAAVQAGLAAQEHRALSFACVFNHAAMLAALLDAYGERGGAALQAGLAAGQHGALNVAIDRGHDAVVALLLEAYSAPAILAVLRSRLAARPPLFPRDSPVALLAVQMPEVWAVGGGDTGRQLLSAANRWAVAAPVLLALSRLPRVVGGPLLAYLKARPWLAFTVRPPAPAP